jgi:hypothetical protein
LQVLAGVDPAPAFKYQEKKHMPDVVTKISDPTLLLAASSLIRCFVDKVTLPNLPFRFPLFSHPLLQFLLMVLFLPCLLPISATSLLVVNSVVF